MNNVENDSHNEQHCRELKRVASCICVLVLINTLYIDIPVTLTYQLSWYTSYLDIPVINQQILFKIKIQFNSNSTTTYYLQQHSNIKYSNKHNLIIQLSIF